MTNGPRNPPTTPTELTNAIPPAAAVPPRNDEVRVKKGPQIARMPIATHVNPARAIQSDFVTLATTEPNAASKMGITTCQTRSPVASLERPQSTIAISAARYGSGTIKPVTLVE